MRTFLSKLTSKCQMTVPKAIRELLHLTPKDQIAYDILDDNSVIIRKATSLDIEYIKALQHTLTEWNSDEDEKAYRNL